MLGKKVSQKAGNDDLYIYYRIGYIWKGEYYPWKIKKVYSPNPEPKEGVFFIEDEE